MSEFESRFWDTIGAGPEWHPDHILQALPGSVQRLGDRLRASSGTRTIVVATIQSIQQIHANGEIARLRGVIGTIIFDEGHREPAPLWAGAEREIWLVCAGGMLSKSALESEFSASPPKAHVLQFYHLVISAYSACQSVGVNLKIFCSP